MTIVFNRLVEKQKRRQLRLGMSEPEVILWSRLQNKAMKDYKFRRQYGIGRYVVDFYCPKAKLAIEVDGDSHSSADAQEYDRIREDYIRSLGIKTVRFTNTDVCMNLRGVLSAIEGALTPPTSQRARSHLPLVRGGKGAPLNSLKS